MATPSRRAVLQGATMLAAVPFATWWPAQAQQPFIRHSAFSQEGKNALASYAKAVDAMVKLSAQDPTDPLGWFYQYKIHLFPDNGGVILFDPSIPKPERRKKLREAQDAELTEFFGAAGPANVKRAQAQASWGKCPHHMPAPSDFMPWHRKYLFFFERIVRTLSGDNDFALPYWGYMDGIDEQRIPAAFIAAGSNPLAHGRAEAITQGGTMDPTSFQGAFWNNLKTFAAFSSSAENAPHDPVHDEVGAPNFDMSDLFRSPRDPIFWLHHCEIDRIWEGGRAANVPDPTGDWLTHKHFFFDENRQLVEVLNSDVLDTKQIKTWPGYSYDVVPKPPQAAIVMAQALQPESRRVLATATDVPLTSGLQTQELKTTPESKSLAPLAAGGPRTITLEVSAITLDRRAVATVALYLNAPAGAAGKQLDPYFVGTVSTFALLPKGVQMDHGDGEHEAGETATYSFDVTQLVSNLQAQGLWTGNLKLTSKETTGSLEGAAIILGEVKLVETSAGPERQ